MSGITADTRDKHVSLTVDEWFDGRGNVDAFRPEQAKYILIEIANGRTIRDLVREPGMPDQATIYIWSDRNFAGFGSALAQAQKYQANCWADEILEIADEASNDWMLRNNGSMSQNYEAVNRSKLRIGTRQWLMGKHAPERYADKLQLTGANGEALKVSHSLAADATPLDVSRDYSALMAGNEKAVPPTIDAEPAPAAESETT